MPCLIQINLQPFSCHITSNHNKKNLPSPVFPLYLLHSELLIELPLYEFCTQTFKSGQVFGHAFSQTLIPILYPVQYMCCLGGIVHFPCFNFPLNETVFLFFLALFHLFLFRQLCLFRSVFFS